jgi:hypothetical protein
MMNRFFVILAILFLSVPAQSTQFLPWSAGSIAWAAPVSFNVTDYGAVCNGQADDSAAFNAATAAARAVSVIGGTQPARIISPYNQRCLINNPVNFTGFTKLGVEVDMGEIDCATGGRICFDATGSRFIRWHFQMRGMTSNPPSIGLQLSRVDGTTVADLHALDRVLIRGSFTEAPLYNFASETNVFLDCYFYNESTAANTHAIILDGYNHWNASSTFATITAPVDTAASSFNEQLFLGGQFYSTATDSGSSPIWVGGARRTRFIRSYVASLGAPYIVTLYSADVAGNLQFDADLHIENLANVTDVFFLTGPQAAQVLDGFSYHDRAALPSNSIFKADVGVSTVSMRGADILISAQNSGTKMFDSPAIWTVAGVVQVANSNYWNAPASFSGLLTIGTQTQHYFSNVVVQAGSGTPASAVSAPVGSVWLRSDGGANTTLYVKESGTGNTGWAAK